MGVCAMAYSKLLQNLRSPFHSHFPAQAPCEKGYSCVLRRRQRREQVELLKNEAEILAPEIHKTVITEGIDALAQNLDFPARCPQHASNDRKERRCSAPAWANEHRQLSQRD